MDDFWQQLSRYRSQRLTVIAPHPDDEVFALGGTCALAVEIGLHLTVIAVTDGEASHGRSSRITPGDLAERRKAEVEDAYAILGVHPDRRRLHFPDSAVDAAELMAVLEQYLEPDTVVFAPLSCDGHPDHNACGEAGRKMASCLSLPFFSYAVWSLLREERIGPERSTWHIHLPPAVLERKLRAMECFQSQFVALGPLPEDGPVLPESFREAFSHDFEIIYR
jgi:LmbE family N-acetylglucosaminyl deacetylase